MYESWIMDVRYAVRRLMSRPVYAALAIATLALGAGGTAAVYSVARTILLDPLPIAKEEQVGVLWFSGSWREQEFLRLRPNFPGFQRMAAYRPDDLTLESAGQPLRLIPGIAVPRSCSMSSAGRRCWGERSRQGEDLVGARDGRRAQPFVVGGVGQRSEHRREAVATRRCRADGRGRHAARGSGFRVRPRAYGRRRR